MSKLLNTRISQKHDFECNWDSESTSIIPLVGEVIIYDSEVNGNGDTIATLPSGRTNPYNYARVKIGDGIHLPKDLPFVDDAVRELLKDKHEIIDVIELPTENIQEDATYRVLSGTFVSDGVLRNDCTCHIVDWEKSPTSATNGDPVITVNNGEFSYTAYYNIKDKNVYGRLTGSSLSALKNWAESNLEEPQKTAVLLYLNALRPGWKKLDDIVSELGSNLVLSWGGVVTSKDLMTADNTLYLYLNSDMFFYHDNSWVSSDTLVGLKGSGIGAEIFNNLNNVASGRASHAEGSFTSATEDSAHAEGYKTTASGKSSHAEGDKTIASKSAAHAEGSGTQAININSHAEGSNTIAIGPHSHAEGYETTASGSSAHAEGLHTGSSGDFSHAEGMRTTASGQDAHSEGALTSATGAHSHAEGYETTASGSASHAGGLRTSASEDYQTVIGRYNNIEDSKNKAFVIGNGHNKDKLANNAMTVDWDGNANFAGELKSGKKHVLTTSDYITAGRKNGTAVGDSSTAEGAQTTASGVGSHAEGGETIAEGPWAHSEGYGSKALGNSSHAEGLNNTASGDYSHAEGNQTTASGVGSHASGYRTTANGDYQTVIGKLNKQDNTKAFIIGGGYTTTEEPTPGIDALLNLATVDWNGNAEFRGSVKVGTDNKEVATQEYVIDRINKLDAPEVSGSGLRFIQKISETDGIISATTGAIPAATTSQQGVVQLNDSLTSTSTSTAATANAVSSALKEAKKYTDDERGKLDYTSPTTSNTSGLEFISAVSQTDGKISATKIKVQEATTGHKGVVQLSNEAGTDTSTAATPKAIKDAIDALDVDAPTLTDASTLTVISDITQTNGKISATKKSIQKGTTAQAGVIQLVDAINSTSTTTAATANAVKTVYDTACANHTITYGQRATKADGTATAHGSRATAEGYNNDACGRFSHAEGTETTASLDAAHAEGYRTSATGYYSHAEGYNTTASGSSAHAEGDTAEARGANSHAEGYNTVASGAYSHASGYYTTAQGGCQTVVGKHNAADSDSLFIVGNGSEAAPSNAMRVITDGTVEVSKTVKVGTDKLEVATKKDIENLNYTSPNTSNNSGLEFISSVSQSGGQVSATKIKVQEGTTSKKGVVQLTDSSGTSTTTAATPNAIKKAIESLNFTEPDASGTATTVIATVSQTDGKISATKKNLPEASTTAKGIVQLNSATTSTSETLAATPKAVNSALVQAKEYTDTEIGKLNATEPTASGTSTSFIATVSENKGIIIATKKNLPEASTTNKGIVQLSDSSGTSTTTAATPNAIKKAIEALKYTSPDTTNNSGIEFISTVSQTDGKISATKIKVQDGTDSKKGVVKLNNSAGTDTTTAATPRAIKDAIDALKFTAPTASGTDTAFISSVSQTAGKITATKASLPEASTSTKGIVRLNDTVASTSTTQAATANAVREAYDTACSTHYITTGRKAETTVGLYSTAEGHDTIASANYSHAEGKETISGGFASHTEGIGTIAVGTGQHVSGTYNVSDATSLVIIGNGTTEKPSNAHTLDKSGNAWYSGDVKVGGTSYNDDNAKILATREYVIDRINELDVAEVGNTNGITFIQTISETNGKISAIPSAVRNATTANTGVVQLYDNLDSTSVFLAATANAVREAYETACSTHYITTGRKAETFAARYSTAEGYNTTASALYTHAEGYESIASNSAAHAEGDNTRALGNSSHTEGRRVVAMGNYSHAEGQSTNHITDSITANSTVVDIVTAWNSNKFAIAKGQDSHIEGVDNIAWGAHSHAEGNSSRVFGTSAHAEGYQTCAFGNYSHAEGGGESLDYKYADVSDAMSAQVTHSNATKKFSLAHGSYSHVEGLGCLTTGTGSHAEGYGTIAKGNYSHAEGDQTRAEGANSHASGKGTVANQDNLTVIGTYNKTLTDRDYLFVIGNGTKEYPKNAFTVDKWGRVKAQEDICLYSDSGNPFWVKIQVDNIKTDLYDSVFPNIDSLIDYINDLQKRVATLEGKTPSDDDNFIPAVPI